MDEILYLAQYLSHSSANGPGKRAVIWVQGCDKNCYRCCNPQFQDFDANCQKVHIKELANVILSDIEQYGLRGITFSGGEPLHKQHREPIQKLIHILCKNSDIDIMAFTGLTKEEIDVSSPWAKESFDMLIAGPYNESMENLKGILSSYNQCIIRYGNKFDDVTDDVLINGVRKIEMVVNAHGMIEITGLISIEKLQNMSQGVFKKE